MIIIAASNPFVNNPWIKPYNILTSLFGGGSGVCCCSIVVFTLLNRSLTVSVLMVITPEYLVSKKSQTTYVQHVRHIYLVLVRNHVVSIFRTINYLRT